MAKPNFTRYAKTQDLSLGLITALDSMDFSPKEKSKQ